MFAVADDPNAHVALSNDSATTAPGCDTVTVAVCTVAPDVVVTVTVAVRAVTAVFAPAVNDTDPFPVPVPGDTVNQA